jgi:hypothetical protein
VPLRVVSHDNRSIRKAIAAEYIERRGMALEYGPLAQLSEAPLKLLDLF